MYTNNVKTCGFTTPLQNYSTTEEYNADYAALKGDPSITDPALHVANSSMNWRHGLTLVRAAVCARIEEETDWARTRAEEGTKVVGKDAEGANITEPKIVIKETEAAFIARVQVANEEEGLEALSTDQLQAWFTEAGEGVSPDPTGRKVTDKKPKKAYKRHIEIAQRVIDGGGAERAATVLAGRHDIEVEPTLESLARAIMIDEAAKDVAAELLAS